MDENLLDLPPHTAEIGVCDTHDHDVLRCLRCGKCHIGDSCCQFCGAGLFWQSSVPDNFYAEALRNEASHLRKKADLLEAEANRAVNAR